MQPIYGNLKTFTINNNKYLVRSVIDKNDTYFEIRNSTSLTCIVTLNEKHVWQAIPAIDQGMLEEIIACIKSYYPNTPKLT